MEQFELIEKYLSNEMDASEKATFEQNLATDSVLAENFAIYKSINATMQQDFENKETELRDNLAPLQKQYFSEATPLVSITKKKSSAKKLIYTALSAAAILAIVFVFVIPSGKKATAESLYAQYAVHEKVENTVRGGSTDDILQAGTKFYNEKNYAACIAPLQQINDSTGQVRFMLGVAYTETKDFAKAEKELTKLSKSQSIYAEKGAFYLALVYLKNNDKEKCKQQLESIPASSSYSSKAKELLKKL